jgi:hypothetical protein
MYNNQKSVKLEQVDKYGIKSKVKTGSSNFNTVGKMKKK